MNIRLERQQPHFELEPKSWSPAKGRFRRFKRHYHQQPLNPSLATGPLLPLPAPALPICGEALPGVRLDSVSASRRRPVSHYRLSASYYRGAAPDISPRRRHGAGLATPEIRNASDAPPRRYSWIYAPRVNARVHASWSRLRRVRTVHATRGGGDDGPSASQRSDPEYARRSIRRRASAARPKKE